MAPKKDAEKKEAEAPKKEVEKKEAAAGETSTEKPKKPDEAKFKKETDDITAQINAKRDEMQKLSQTIEKRNTGNQIQLLSYRIFAYGWSWCAGCFIFNLCGGVRVTVS